MILGCLFAVIVAQPISGGAQVAVTTNHSGDRLVPLLPSPDPEGRHCTVDAHWCVSLTEAQDGDDQILPIVRAGNAPGPLPQPPDQEAFSNETFALWPNLILLKHGGFLAGVEIRTSAAYSGGGGSATELRLFRVTPDGQAAARPVLSVPVSASLLIRACFAERDMERRRGACHDEYAFTGKLRVAREAAAPLPILTYVTEALAFPRGVSRLKDSTANARLKKSDLVHERDAECSFARHFRFDAIAGSYTPDTPLPECSAYTVP